MRRLGTYWRDQAGAGAIEFALVVPLLCTLTIGAIQMCLLMFINSSLQFAVDDAARCASVATDICTSTGVTQTHAASTFGFTGTVPTFNASLVACGNKVTGTATYNVNAIIASVAVPLTASSCFPVQD